MRQWRDRGNNLILAVSWYPPDHPATTIRSPNLICDPRYGKGITKRIPNLNREERRRKEREKGEKPISHNVVFFALRSLPLSASLALARPSCFAQKSPKLEI